MINLYNGDSATLLKQLPDNSIDSMVTDPPASISFMGKQWDGDKGGRQQWVSWLSGIMQECFRVLKPGSHSLVWALPRTSHYTATAIEDAGFEIRDMVVHLQAQGFPKGSNIGKAAGPKWDGWNTSLKPAAEFWILARKPISEKTVVSNVLEWGTGAINIEASRIATADNLNGGAYAKSGTPRDDGWHMERGGAGEYKQPSGRFPSNVVLSHSPDCTAPSCSTNCPIHQLDEQSGILKSGTGAVKKSTAKGHQGTCYGKENRPEGTPNIEYGDIGGASRFFKQFIYKSKASKSDKGEDNDHPTVKSIALCEYFVNLVTPPGGTVLDPFMGSGSTGVAAVQNGFHFTGIEMDEHYFKISEKRIYSV